MKLYKYMHWRPLSETNYTKENLINYTLYFNCPDNFNDPFDTLPYVNSDHTYKERLDYGTRAVMLNENLPYEKARRKTVHLFKTEQQFKNKNSIDSTAKKQISNLRKQMGVFCVTSNSPETILMWAHYADNHQGICLEFDLHEGKLKTLPGEPPISPPLKITYTDELPKYNIFKKDCVESYLNALTTKSKEWEKENEYRFISRDQLGLVKYDPWQLKSIYAGCKMTDESFKALQDTVHRMRIQPHLFRTVIKKDQFGLDIVKP